MTSLRLTIRELVAAMKTLDRVAQEVNALRAKLKDKHRARLVGQEYWSLNSPGDHNMDKHAKRGRGLARQGWNVTLSKDQVKQGLKDTRSLATISRP